MTRTTERTASTGWQWGTDMQIFYSPGTRAFYSDLIHGDAVPADAVVITQARHRELLTGQASGRAIIAGEDGFPRLQPAARLTTSDRRAQLAARNKREAARRIEAISPLWRQINDQRDPSDAGAARFVAIDAIRAASDAIEAQIATAAKDALAGLDIPNHPLWPAE